MSLPLVDDRRMLNGATSHAGARQSSAARMSLRAAAAVTAIPVVIALVTGFFGVFELRSALAFDKSALAATALRTSVLRLQLAEESDLRAVTRHPAALAALRTASARVDGALFDLQQVVREVGVPDGPAQVEALAQMHRTWETTVAQPTLAGIERPAERARIDEHGRSLLGAYRLADLQVGDAIETAAELHANSFETRFVRIGLLFAASLFGCALAVALGAAHLMRTDRARARAESLLREREILYDQSRLWSDSFQRAVLPPRLPDAAACRFDAVYEPGSGDANIGGDWYDAVRLLDGRILISIGDVAGSGLEAAVVMGVVRQIMRGIAQVHASPALMLDAADRALRIEYSDAFVTAWVGIVDLVTRSVSYASAGHPPALVVTPDGVVTELAGADLPLGLRQGNAMPAHSVDLADGSMLVLYTDGLTEATRNVEEGEARLRATVAAVARRPWAAPASEIVAGVLTSRATDDVAVLATKLDFAVAEREIRRVRFDVRDRGAARAARNAAVSRLEELGASVVGTLNAELILSELLGNVIRHAPGDPMVDVIVDASGPRAVLHVLDRGPGFRHISRLPLDPLSESGRGLFMISALSDDFSVVERTGGGSHARVVLPEPVVRTDAAPDAAAQPESVAT